MISGVAIVINEKKLIRFVAHLIEKTQDGEIKWINPSFNPTFNKDIIVGDLYQTSYENKILRLYEQQSKSFYDADPDSYNWSPEVVLAFVDRSGNNTWEVPNSVPGLWDLLETARYKSAGIDDFLTDILPDVDGEDEDPDSFF